MHLLAGETGGIETGEAAVDLGQSPGDILVLSAADTELGLLAQAARGAGASVRLCNLMRLAHPLSVDLFVDATAARAKIVLVRMMGGAGYWTYGLERLRALSRAGGPALVVVPGDDRWDAALEAFTTEPQEIARRLWRTLVEGGAENATRALALMAHRIGLGDDPGDAEALPRCGVYRPGQGVAPFSPPADHRPVVPVVFYRSILQGGATAPIDMLAEALQAEGLTPLPLFVASLKDGESQDFLRTVLEAAPPAVVLNATAFAVSAIGAAHRGTVLDAPGRPVLQVILAGSSEAEWRDGTRGLLPRDLTMNVVLPEVDGRIGTRAVSFKAEVHDAATDSRIATYEPVPDRIRFVAAQAASWARLGAKPAAERRVALILSNYPNRASRIGNAVGLDTIASAMALAEAMVEAGYHLSGFPVEGATLVEALKSPPAESLAATDHIAFLSRLPESSRAALGSPPGGDIPVAAIRFGNVVVAVQPSRGGGEKASLHDADLVPTHDYVAFHGWLRDVFEADAIVHLGKHGNLEWLPGKALALSAECWPELCLGPVPLVYPFIVNDPGEGAQAKRRASAVVIDHLTPPMTRAELHGPLAALETMIDEYALAAGMDRRRREYLEREIVSTAVAAGLDRDLGLADVSGEALATLDAYLCDLKEMQVRDGLHVLGAGPSGQARVDMLVALARAPRPGVRPADASLHRAIAADLGLGDFDPLSPDMAAPWEGARPDVLAALSNAPWRTAGDTLERIERLAAALVSGGDAPGPASAAVLAWIASDLAPALDASGPAEIAATLAALDGRFVAPGPSGAPSRGRPEVLPTGRNFYTVDIRAVPTAAAWALGRAAADAMALRYFQDEGEWPRSVALSAWGTSNMRTGGDDIATALALVGAEPVWEAGTGRVTGFRILALADLRRPRIDVTLRISGMFRDAFPEQIALMASAFRAVAALDEDDAANPLAAAARGGEGTARIFGTAPGRYGAGIERLIDQGAWAKREDLAEAFLAFGSHAYGGDAGSLAERLKAADAVLHTQDNREHDILDSADYPEFQGGLAAAVAALRGAAPRVYHADNSRPETPVVRSLGEEISRVVRGRATNPKWLAGMMRHGHRGAMEIAATVDLLFAYAALTDAVGDHHFDRLYEAYILDDAVRGFIAEANPEALRDMAARFREAMERGLWSPRHNSAHARLAQFASRKEAAE